MNDWEKAEKATDCNPISKHLAGFERRRCDRDDVLLPRILLSLNPDWPPIGARENCGSRIFFEATSKFSILCQDPPAKPGVEKI